MYNAFESIQAFEAGQGRKKEREDQAGRVNIGNAFARGDYTGAANTAYGMGDLSTGMDISKYGKGLEDAEAEQRRQGLMRYGLGLLQTPAEQREAMRPQIAQTLAQIGVELPPEQLAQMDLSDAAIQATLQSLQDPETLMAQYQKAQEPYTLAPGARRFGPGGQEVAANPVAPKAPEPFTLGTGQVRYNPDGTEMARGPDRIPSNGITIGPDGTVQIGGPAALDGIGYGSAGKGQDAAIVQGRDGSALVSPGPQQEVYSKAVRNVQEFESQSAIVIDDIDRAIESVSMWSAGPGAALAGLPIVGGITEAGGLQNLLSTIEANVGFDKLQAMRESSPTGGALGNVTERELAFLQSVFGSLKQDQSPKNLKYNLERLRAHMEGRGERLRAALAADFPSLQDTAQFRSGANRQTQDLNDLYEFMTPEERALFEGDQ